MKKYKIINFRDMGSIMTEDGSKLKNNMLFRSSMVNPKNINNINFIDSLKLDSIVDFRNPSEINRMPDYVPEGCEYIKAPVLIDYSNSSIMPDNLRKFIKTAKKEDIEGVRQEWERTYAFMPFAKEAYGNLFQKMNEGKRILFHCIAGKDRTGIAAMMIQLALGCSKESAIIEYLKTNEYRKRSNTFYLALVRFSVFLVKRKHLLDYFTMCAFAQKIRIEIAINSIFDKYGTIQEFLLKEYGIAQENIENWKAFYLE